MKKKSKHLTQIQTWDSQKSIYIGIYIWKKFFFPKTSELQSQQKKS